MFFSRFSKKLLRKLLLLIPFLGTTAYAEPAVWLAKSPDRQFILLGSIHAGNEQLFPLPKAFLQQWPNADGLVVEANILAPTRPHLDPTIPSAGTILTDVEKATLADIANKAGLSYPALLQSPPWLTAISLQMSMAQQAGLTPQQGIDIKLLKRASHDNMPILELESVQQQVDLMEAMPDHGKDLLISTLTEWHSVKSQLNCLTRAWRAGDQAQLSALFEQSQYSDQTSDALIFDRNHNWAESLSSSPAYHQGKYMVVVGAMHLIGQQGLPTLLKQKGFTVTQITQGSDANCPID
ncbi:polysaccharide biosynthesis protein GumN [Photobacterium aquae]|uniref:Polysaccharide biosynthesis protein GumN n=1 Tax=Photobacterium aquae TaxID=1195763 RepID=A0A0J1HCA6_9GAMM|nr:polysaccharide biosynthesis protein GumN [Photobacterium aquae]